MKISRIIFLIFISINLSNINVQSKKAKIKKPEIEIKQKTEKGEIKKEKSHEQNDEIITEITGLTEIKNIGDKPIIIGIHGVGEGGKKKIGSIVGTGEGIHKGGWWLFEGVSPNRIPKIKDCDLITFQWKQGKYTKGMRDKDIIEAAKSLVNLILNILRDIRSREIREKKTITLKLIIIAHSMGGNVLKAALNLLDHQYKKIKLPEKTGGIIKTIKRTIMGIIRTEQSYQSPANYDFVDTKYNENKKSTKTIKDKFTRKYYETANNEIENRMQLMSKAGSIPKHPFIEACYTLGTPNRHGFPFNEDMDVTKAFYCLFSYGDKIQKNAGLTRIPEGEDKFNIRVKIIKEGKEADPNHNQLIRDTSIIHKILDINKENIENNLNQYLEEKIEQAKADVIIEKFQADPSKAVEVFLKNTEDEEELKKEDEKEKETQEKRPKEIKDIKKSIQTITITFPEQKYGKLLYEFDTNAPPKETLIQKTVKVLEFKI